MVRLRTRDRVVPGPGGVLLIFYIYIGLADFLGSKI